jgi:hypothetical protein
MYVLPEFRGGLSKWLMQTIIEYPDYRVAKMDLSTADAGLYEQFVATSSLSGAMDEMHNKEVYSANAGSPH